MKVCDDFMKNLSPEKIREIKEKDKEIRRNDTRIALMTIEEFLPDVFNDCNDPCYSDVAIFSNEIHYLTDPAYLQNVFIYTASCLLDTLLDNEEINLLMHCKITDINISYHPYDDTDFLIVTFEFPNHDDIEYYSIAIKCNVKDAYILF